MKKVDLKPIRNMSFSPSSIARVVACTGSAFLVSCAPASDPTSFSQAGTDAHALGEHCLKNNTSSFDYVGKTFGYIEKYDKSKHTFKVDADTAEAVASYVEYINSKRKTGSSLYVEFKLQSNLFDTGKPITTFIDACIDNSGVEIVVADYKNGTGEVLAEDNKQLAMGALFALENFANLKDNYKGATKPPKKLTMAIIQPNTHGEAVDEWCIDGEKEVKRFKKKYTKLFGDAIFEAQTSFDYVIGDHCHYCNGKVLCPLAQKEVDNMIDELAGGEDAKASVEALSNEKVVEYLDSSSRVKKFTEELVWFAKQKMKNGEKIPGKKVVTTTKNYKSWSDEAQAVEAFKKDLLLTPQQFSESKLLSPAKITKLIKSLKFEKEDFETLTGLITLTEKSYETIVDASDKRPDANSVEDDFANEFKG